MPTDLYGGGSLDDLKDYWQRRTSEAFDFYLHAVEQHRRMKEELGHGLTPLADGSFVVLKARRALGMARSEFLRIQKTYIDLLLGKKAPPPDDERPLI